MFTSTWKKYLPVIAILLKKCNTDTQTLSVNHTDFERAAGGRKIKYSFSNLLIKNGKTHIATKYNHVATDLANLLREEASTKSLLQTLTISIALSNEFKLTIKNVATETSEDLQNTLVDEIASEDVI